jgi:predicted nuclease with TOPRIM domain
MQDIQEIFNRIQQAKKKQKDIMAAFKDALASSTEYQDTNENLKNLRTKKKQVEITIREQFSSEFTKLDDLKIDIESDTELLSDIALTKVMKGEGVEITDEYGNKFEPVFRVKFKKTT